MGEAAVALFSQCILLPPEMHLPRIRTPLSADSAAAAVCLDGRSPAASAIESSNPIDSIEESIYTDNREEKSISLIDKISTGEDEQTLISNRLTFILLVKQSR